MINKKIIATGSILAMISIILGALGAHGLKSMPSIDSYHISIFNKGVQYQFYHAISIILLGILAHYKISIKWPFILFITGVILFSGSLYMLALAPAFNINTQWIGPITPIGGICYIIGWAVLTYNTLKK